jgi:hypothetical protein
VAVVALDQQVLMLLEAHAVMAEQVSIPILLGYLQQV